MGWTKSACFAALVFSGVICADARSEALHYWMQAIEPGLEERCVVDRADAYDTRLVQAARLAECPKFVPIAPQFIATATLWMKPRMREDSAVCSDYLERSWRGMAMRATVSDVERKAFCWEARKAALGCNLVDPSLAPDECFAAPDGSSKQRRQ
jgi:hypothetical protein